MKPYFCGFLLVIGMTLASCASNGPVIIPTGTQTKSPSPTFIQPTYTNTPQPMQTPTLTPPPTLEPMQAEETISKLLREPLDCGAPCFWGIVPGQTTRGEAKNIFTRLGLQIKSTSIGSKEFDGILYNFDSGLSIMVTLTIQGDIVSDLRVDINPEIRKSGVPREWLAYSPETLITRYGPPSRVNIGVDTGPRTSFGMDMYFDAVDLIVGYGGYNIIATSWQVCPLTDQYDSVRLWMGKDPVYPPAEAVSLEKATSMTIAEFSKLMTGNPDSACFNLNAEMFR